MKKIIKTVMLLCVAASMLAGAVSVSAATYEPVAADVLTAVSENFDSYTENGEYVQLAGATANQADIAICENWAITSGANKTLSTTTQARVTAATTTTDEETGETKETRSAHLEFGYETSAYDAYRDRNSYVTYTGDVSEIGLPYKIKFNLEKDSFNSTTVIRFGIDSTKKNYYQLVLSGKTKGSTDNKQWIFEKIENGSVAATVVPDWEYTKTDAYDNEFIKKAVVEIIVAEDGVSWHIDGNNAIGSDGAGNDYSANYREYVIDETFKDNVSAGNMGVGFVTLSAGAHFVRIDNFSIGDYSEYVGAEAEPDAIYTDIIKNIAADGTVTLSGKYPVRKIVNNSSVAAEVCVPSGDTYLTLAEIPAGEAFVNTLTEASYDTLKVIGGTDIAVYGDKINLRGGTDAYVAAVVGGEEAEITSENGKVAYVNGNRIYGMYDGTAKLTASNANGSISSNAYVNTVSTDTFDYPATDAVEFTADGIANGDLQLGDSPWYLSKVAEGLFGRNVKANLNGSAVNMTNLTSIGDASPFNSPKLPVVRYCGDYAGIGDSFKIAFDMTKPSISTRSVAKFMLHNDDKDYYYLMLSNNVANAPNWEFGKVMDNEIIETVSSAYLTIAASPYTNVLHDKNSIEITVEGNEISWSINGYTFNKKAFVDSGVYVDTDPFTVNPEETTVGFMAQGQESQTMQIDNFTIAPIEPEMKVVDLTEGSNVVKAMAFRDVETGKAIVAKYNADKSLAAVEITDIENSFAEVKSDVSSADSAKLILLEDWTAVNPITDATVLK